jgi:hypothetical protein
MVMVLGVMTFLVYRCHDTSHSNLTTGTDTLQRMRTQLLQQQEQLARAQRK